ncbi:MAG: AAA family ATPase [Candidatus Aenigmarchaeota archaeon]|nr:AAA family ATPase [Candidatus Aenigmarchaeota archaeon]
MTSNKGISKVFKYFIEKIVKKDNQKFLKEEELKKVIDSINSVFSKITLFKEYKLEEESNPVELIARILKIKDKNDLDIFKSGHGFQFSLILFLYILARLIQLKENKRKKDCIFGNKNQKSLSLILGLDEPEIHLHPFMQRQLIKELQKIIRNENNEFKSILKEIFSENEEYIEGIKINGQMFVVTHSPYILTNDVEQYIRFLRRGGNLEIISGIKLSLEEGEYKQFLLQIKNIKESFFSKCCLIVEGDMEYGIFPYFLDKISKMHRDLERNREAVFLINAGSKNNIRFLFKVLDFFHIPTFVIADGDYNYEKNREMKNSIENLYFTKYKDFEEELVNKLIKLGKEDLLIEFIREIDKDGISRTFQKKKLQDINDKYKLGLSIQSDVKLEEIRNSNKILKKLWLLTWLNINKSVYIGQRLGEFLFNEKKLDWRVIPDVYFKVTYLSLEKVKYE